MKEHRFRSITEQSIASGRCFAYQAESLYLKGIISEDDPRYIHRKMASTDNVAKNYDDYRLIWDNLLAENPPPAVKANLLVGLKSFSKEADSGTVGESLAICMESAATDLFQSNNEDTRDLARKYVHKAAFFCDSEVLKQRHLDEKSSVSIVSRSSGIPSHRILSGMMRKGLMDESDFRVLAYVEGYTAEYNAQNREDFFRSSSNEIKYALTELGKASPTDEQKKQLTGALSRLAISNESNETSAIKETSVLEASAELSESLGAAWAETDPERAKRLAGICMSACVRSSMMRDQHGHQLPRIAPKKDSEIR